MWAAGQHDRVVNHNGEWEAESVRILRNPGGGSGMKGHSCLYASTSDARRNDGKRPGRMFSIIGPACQARLIKTLVLTVLMTWHIDQLKPKTPLLVALAGCLWILVHMCAHERSLLSFSANRKPSWLLRGGGLECMSVSLVQWEGNNTNNGSVGGCSCFVCQGGQKNITFDDVWQIKQAHSLQRQKKSNKIKK